MGARRTTHAGGVITHERHKARKERQRLEGWQQKSVGYAD